MKTVKGETSVTTGTQRAVRALTLAPVALAVVAVLGACAIDGVPSDSLSHRSVAPAAFPVAPGSVAITVPPAQLPAIIADLSGVPPGARVDPEDCVPHSISMRPADTVVQTGFGPDTAGEAPPAYTTVITRTDQPLAHVSSTVARCGRYRRTSGVEVAVVQRVLESVPAVRGATVFGYVRTETAAGVPPVTTTLLLAQRGNVRVYAARRAAGFAGHDGNPDDALLALFAAVAAAGLR